METLAAVGLTGLLAYLLYDGKIEAPTGPRKRLCDYYAAGSVFEPVDDALRRGIRVLEVHVYSDEDDQPVVAKKSLSEGYDYVSDNVSFESVCVSIVNDAFPSKDPCVLSIVSHTDKTVTLNKVAYHLNTTVRQHLTNEKDVATVPIDLLANKLILVSGGNVHGTDLEPLINLDWNGSSVRRLTYQQGLYPRDVEELQTFSKEGIVLVAADPDFSPVSVNPYTPVAYRCQWNFYLRGPGGFLERKE
jgi:hypothetical protein